MSELDDLAAANQTFQRRQLARATRPKAGKARKQDATRVTVAIVVLAVMAMAGVAAWVANNNRSAAGGAAPSVSVSATAMMRDYLANEVAADAKYRGRVIEVSGIVEHVGRDLTDGAYVSLKTGDLLRGVQCSFDRGQEGAAALLGKGDRVSIRGTGDGLMVNALLKGCVIVGSDRR